MSTSGRIRLGISACLLGAPVRYDGRDKRDVWLAEAFADIFDYIPVCPEVECGLPVPREPMQLEGDFRAPRLVGIESRREWTARMLSWSRQRCEALAREALCGFIFKARSPSCGLDGVDLFGADGKVRGGVSGLFACCFQAYFPEIPTVEAERLCDRPACERFLGRVRQYVEAKKSSGSSGQERER